MTLFDGVFEAHDGVEVEDGEEESWVLSQLLLTGLVWLLRA